MTRVVELPGAEDLAAAERAVRSVLSPTPVVEALGMWLKLETVQPTGSFKVRGGVAALAARPAGGRVVTASAGNHGLGLAYAAAQLGRAATVVVPETASAAKVERLRSYPVELVQVGDGYDAAEAHALSLDGEYVSPYNDPHVIAGQRTVGVELGEQLSGPLTVAVPVGGGGLVSGVGLWAAGREDVRVVGVEVEASRSVSAAVRAGRVVDTEQRPTLADGMAGNCEPGSVTVDIAARHVDAFVAVGEGEVRAAMRALALEAGLIAEGAGAAATAAVLSGRVADERPGARVVAIVSGRNLTRGVLVDVLSS
jgi:threonine dehydratase